MSLDSMTCVIRQYFEPLFQFETNHQPPTSKWIFLSHLSAVCALRRGAGPSFRALRSWL
jgi:hypothetical protein